MPKPSPSQAAPPQALTPQMLFESPEFQTALLRFIADNTQLDLGWHKLTPGPETGLPEAINLTADLRVGPVYAPTLGTCIPLADLVPTPKHHQDI